jgi:hypothetical protein
MEYHFERYTITINSTFDTNFTNKLILGASSRRHILLATLTDLTTTVKRTISMKTTSPSVLLTCAQHLTKTLNCH